MLTEDKTVDALTVNEGVTLNLNGYKLTCTSLAGSGTITSPDGDTDLTSPQGTVTGTYLNDSGVDTELSGGSYAALFDDDFTNYGNPHRLLSGSLAYGKHLTVVYDFGEGAATVVNKFKIYNGQYGSERNPFVWQFEGKNDEDSEWTTLQTVGGYTHEGNTWTYTGSLSESWGSSASKTNVVHTFENTTAYRYYRFVFIKTNSAYCELKQVEFFNTNPGELHVNASEGGDAGNSAVTISGNVKVFSGCTGSFIVGVDIDVNEVVFTAGAGAALIVAKGKTLTTESISGIGKILNHGTIIKMGAESVDWPFDNASEGLYVISEGRVNVKSQTGTVNTGSSQIVRVKNGATFDTRGINGHNFSVVLEEGSRLANSTKDLDGVGSQVLGLTLEGNATVVHHKTFGLRAPQHAETTLDLGTYTLTLDSIGKHSFILDNTTITGTGTIFVKNGTLYATMDASVGEDCTVSIDSGAGLNLGKNLTVGNFVNNGSISGSGNLMVCGELTPGEEIPKLTLADGATVKASADNAQTVNNGFSASGTVTIDASDITKAQLNEAMDQRIAVLTIPTANKSGVWTVANPPVVGCLAKWVDNGDNTSTLYIVKPTGFRVIIR